MIFFKLHSCNWIAFPKYVLRISKIKKIALKYWLQHLSRNIKASMTTKLGMYILTLFSTHSCSFAHSCNVKHPFWLAAFRHILANIWERVRQRKIGISKLFFHFLDIIDYLYHLLGMLFALLAKSSSLICKFC